jgi:YVTN family beta-propeller protein
MSLRNLFFAAWFAASLLLSGSGLSVAADPVPPPGQCFSETGKCVRGLFYAYWMGHGGLAQQGYPITDEFNEVSAVDGQTYRVQYFERARFELHPEKVNTPYVVLLGLIGQEQFNQRYPKGRPANATGEVCFEETQRCIRKVFHDYWLQHGGLAQMGFPISDEFEEVNQADGKTYPVQYFERARFEYHAENAGTPFEVLLGLLGQEAFTQKYPNGQPDDSKLTVAPVNIYMNAMGTEVNQTVADLSPRVYVPNEQGGNVVVIDPTTFQVIDRLPVGKIPHHVTPSWDMSKLYVNVMGSNTLAEIDPRTGKISRNISTPAPYNLYYTPDGTKAVVAAEPFNRLDFYDAKTWQPLKRLQIPWLGVDHMDMSADGTYLLVSTEFSGVVIKVSTVTMEIMGAVNLGGLTIDVRLSPDGTVFYVANQARHGVSVVDPVAMKEVQFIPTGLGAHGLHVSRDAKSLYVSNRSAGSISVVDFETRTVRATWNIGGSPDMLQISPDGTQLWASGRNNGVVYVVDTRSGQLLKTIPTGPNPHGLTYFPQPGKISIGHNGVYR